MTSRLELRFGRRRWIRCARTSWTSSLDEGEIVVRKLWQYINQRRVGASEGGRRAFDVLEKMVYVTMMRGLEWRGGDV